MRRVQFTGKSTFIISIPKEWAKNLGISKGSKVFIDLMPDGSLRVRPEPRFTEVKLVKVIDLRKGSSMATAAREFIAAYMAGYDVFKILYDEESSRTLKELRAFVEYRVANILVAEENESYVSYKVIGAPRPLSVTDTLSWLKRLITVVFQEIVRGARQGDLEVLNAVRERDNVVDKAFLVIVRNLTSTLMGANTIDSVGLHSHAEALHYYRAFKTVERIGDHLNIIAWNTARLVEAKMDTSAITELLEEAAEKFTKVIDGLMRVDADAAREVALDIESFRERLRRVELPQESLEYHDIMLSLGRVVDYTLDLAEITFDIASTRSVTKVLYE
ncbi:MAG: phosphate uptake regulator PhoU [Acidilobaceae archaeon]